MESIITRQCKKMAEPSPGTDIQAILIVNGVVNDVFAVIRIQIRIILDADHLVVGMVIRVFQIPFSSFSCTETYAVVSPIPATTKICCASFSLVSYSNIIKEGLCFLLPYPVKDDDFLAKRKL